MDLNSLNNRENKSLTEEYIARIQFKPLATNKDLAYNKTWDRIQSEKLVAIGVSPVWKYISIAASLALLIVSTLSVIFYNPKTTEQIAYLEVSSVSGAKTKVVLPDSTMVWLNSNSRIRYPRQFTADSRNVKLEGEAMFNVSKNKHKPFIVSIDGMRVKVLGTKFNIHTSDDSDIIETTLLEGSVALFKESNYTGVADQILKPDQQALFNKKNGEMEVLNLEADSYASWVSGVFEFNKMTLQEITTSLQRAFDVKIDIQNESLKSVRLTAQFNRRETLDEILSILQISGHFKYEKVKGRINIKRE